MIQRGGLKEFMKLAWQVVEPTTPLSWGWHLDAICDHAQALFTGGIQRLLITVPPGTTKSLTCAVMAPAWMWTHKPSMRMLFASYSSTLSVRDSVKCRRVIESPWYQERWGHVFKLTTDQNAKMRFENDKTGLRVATSVGGTVTGDRGDVVVCDDLLDRKRAESAAHRQAASDFFWETLPSRVNDLTTGRFLVIMQRLHSKDTAGEIIERAGKDGHKWEHLNLPMEYEPTTRVTSIGFSDPRTVEGELLQPSRNPKEKIDQLKIDLGSYAYAGQYQQRPVPREGGMIKEPWLNNRFKCELSVESLKARMPKFVFQTIDAASKPKERNDPTVGLTLASFPDRVELWDLFRKRMEFPDAMRTVKDFGAKWSPSAILIEDKDAGQQLIQQLRRDTKLPIIAMQPGVLDKVTRMAAESPFIEAGKLWLPDEATWLADFVTELTLFPQAEHDDLVDALSQALRWLRSRPMLRLVGPAGETQKSEHIIE